MQHTHSNRGTPIGNDVTKIVRQHYRTPPEEPYCHEIIRCRSDKVRQKDKPEDYWPDNYHRRQENLRKGYFSLPWERYSPIGDVILDPYELIITTMPESLDRRVKYRRRGTIYEPDVSISSISTTQVDELSVSNSDRVDSCPTAGFSQIKKHINETVERITAIKGGMHYEDHIKKIEDRKNLLSQKGKQDDSEMVLMSLSSLFLPPQESSSSCETKTSRQSPCLRSPLHRSPFNLFSRSPSPKKDTRFFGGESGSPEKTPSVLSSASRKSPKEKPAMDHLIHSTYTNIFQRKERMMRDHYLFLLSLFNLLTSLQNLRTRDLRVKSPLSIEALKALLSDRENNTEPFGRNSRAMPGQARKSQSRRWMTSTESVMETHKEAGGSDARAGSIFSTARKAMTMDVAGLKLFGRRRSKKVEDMLRPERLETWEDLLNVQPGQADPYEGAGGNMSPGFGYQVGLITKFMKWYRRTSATPQPTMADAAQTKANIESDKPPQQPQTPRKLPIWQQVAQEKSSVFQDKKKTDPKPETAVFRFRRDFFTLKRTLEKENEAELEKLTRTKVANLRLKFSALNEETLCPLFEIQRYKVQSAKNRAILSRLDNIGVQSAKWFEELEEKTAAVIGSYEHADINQIMMKLQKFAQLDNKSIYVAKAKLCLLVMSLPAYEICQIYIQKALKFVFDNILLGQEAQFLEWLSLRKIRYVVIEN